MYCFFKLRQFLNVLFMFYFNVFIFMHLADAFIQSDLQLHSGCTFLISICVPWESNPQPFALVTQCSTTEPQEQEIHFILIYLGKNYCPFISYYP